MGRKSIWPPTVHSYKGYDRCRVRGVDYHLGVSGSDQARAAYAALLVKLSNAETAPSVRPVAPGVLTVANVANAFLAHAKTAYSERGRELPQFVYSVRPLTALFGRLPAADFTPKKLKQVRSAMASGSWMSGAEKAEHARRNMPVNWCRGVVNRRLVRLKTLWQWAESEELVPPGSTAALRTVKGMRKNDPGVRHSRKRQSTTWEDLQKVVPFCPPAVAVMLQLQWWTGMRSQDVRLFRLSQLDTSREIWAYTPEIDKGDWREGAEEAPRVVQLGPECQAMLVSWFDTYPVTDGYLFAPVRHRRKQPCYTVFSYAQAVRRASERAGVKVLPYGGRHAAKDRVVREMGIDAARAYLGQKSVQTTALYGTLDQQHAAEVAKKMG